MKEIYLDNSATTRPTQLVIERMKKTLKLYYGNPSSLHRKGMETEEIIEDCRKKIKDILGVKREEIFFTSGGTESNNLAIKGIAWAYEARGRHIICSQIEHPSILEQFRFLGKKGFRVTYLPVDEEGFIKMSDLKSSLGKETILVSIIHVNNEVGTLQPLEEMSRIIQEYSQAFFHCDMVQSFRRIPVKIKEPAPHLITLSGHKVHAPKGVGVLYKKEGIALEPLFHGGPQESALRPGTENVLAIAGLSASLECNLENERVLSLRDYLSSRILASIPRAKRITPLKDAAPHILSISFPGMKGEVLVQALDAEGIYLSTGSACHSRLEKISHVLEAIGLSNREAQGTLRISLSHLNTKDEMEITVNKICQVIDRLSRFRR